MDSEALVVGAGPTGLTMAIELLRRGIDTRIVDRSQRRNPHAKAIILQPRALDVFARLGLAARVREMALPIEAANYYAVGHRVARINYGDLPGSRFGVPLSLPQNETESILLDVLESLGGQVEYGQEVRSVEQGPDSIVANISGGQHRCRWLLGCDGAHSAVRASSHVAFTGATYQQSFVLVDGEWDTPLRRPEAHYFMGASGVLVVVGLPGGLIRVFGSAPAGTHAVPVEQTVREIAAARSPVPLELRSPIGSGLFQVHRRIADRFRCGRILLAGDAAHVHSPAGGQGLNTSIQDAHEAAWRLAAILRGTMTETALDEWERERMHVARAIIADTDRQTRLWTWRGPRARVRNLTMKTAESAGILDRKVPPRTAQLNLRYPSTVRGRGRLAPGVRFPDIRVPDGRWTHDLLNGGSHLLLAAGQRIHGTDTKNWIEKHLARHQTDAAPPDSSSRHAAVSALNVLWTDGDAGSAIVRELGTRRAVTVLVRPDGVIAAAGLLDDPKTRNQIDQLVPIPITHEENV